MRVRHVGVRLRGFFRPAQVGHRGAMTPNDARHRLKMLHFARHGVTATSEVFGVSRRTLYHWKPRLTQA